MSEMGSTTTNLFTWPRELQWELLVQAEPFQNRRALAASCRAGRETMRSEAFWRFFHEHKFGPDPGLSKTWFKAVRHKEQTWHALFGPVNDPFETKTKDNDSFNAWQGRIDVDKIMLQLVNVGHSFWVERLAPGFSTSVQIPFLEKAIQYGHVGICRFFLQRGVLTLKSAIQRAVLHSRPAVAAMILEECPVEDRPALIADGLANLLLYLGPQPSFALWKLFLTPNGADRSKPLWDLNATLPNDFLRVPDTLLEGVARKIQEIDYRNRFNLYRPPQKDNLRLISLLRRSGAIVTSKALQYAKDNDRLLNALLKPLRQDAVPY